MFSSFHCLWQCPRVREFWEEVRLSVQEILSIRLDLEARIFLLGLYPEGHRIKLQEIFFINICSLQAKRTIALSWKNFGKPAIAVWFKPHLWKKILTLLRTDRRYFKMYGVVPSNIWRTMICRAWWSGQEQYRCTLCTTQFFLFSCSLDYMSMYLLWTHLYGPSLGRPPDRHVFCFILLVWFGAGVHSVKNTFWQSMFVHFCTILHTSLLFFVLVCLFIKWKSNKDIV